ncbi:hypothetical protein ACFV6I_39030, partial [Kitasatospora sp. NPDC059803]
MSDAVPEYGFTSARRGYAPEQVDRALTALTAQRDEAWERLSVLGSGLRQFVGPQALHRPARVVAPGAHNDVLNLQAP